MPPLSNLRKNAASLNRNRRLWGTIVDMVGDRVSVQVGGKVLRGLRLLGGPVQAGDRVGIDYSNDTPVVIAYANSPTPVTAQTTSASGAGATGTAKPDPDTGAGGGSAAGTTADTRDIYGYPISAPEDGKFLTFDQAASRMAWRSAVNGSASGTSPIPAMDAVFTPTVTGTIRYMATTGSDSTGTGTLANPWKTAAHAVSQMSPGDELQVRGGVYYERFWIADHSKDGTDATHMIGIVAYPGETPVFDGTGTSLGVATAFFNVRQNYWYIRGLEIRNSGGIGLMFMGNHCVAQKCKVHHHGGNGILLSADDCIAEDNECYRLSLHNEYYTNTAENQTGISAARGVEHSPACSYRCIIRRNLVYETWGEQISSFEADGTIIQGNISRDAMVTLYYISDSANVWFEGNVGYYNHANSYIWSYGGTHIGLEWGSELNPPTMVNITVINNIFYGCNRNLYRWNNGSDVLNNVLIAHNIFWGGPNIPVVIAQNNHINTRFCNNIIISDDPAYDVASLSTNITYDHNIWSKALPSGTGSGTGDYVGDPLLAKIGSPYDNPRTSGYYTPVATSPAINTGATDAGVTLDFMRYTRSDIDATPDIGPFEYWDPASFTGGGGGGTGDMTKATYDTNNNGIVDQAEAISGTPGNNLFYGTNGSGVKGFYAVSSSGDMLKSVYDTNNNGIVDQASALAGLPADATKYYDGTGNWSIPAGGGGGGPDPTKIWLITGGTHVKTEYAFTEAGLNAAITAAGTSSMDEIILPVGTISMTASLTVAKNVIIRGQGMMNTKIAWANASQELVIGANEPRFQDLWLYNQAATSAFGNMHTVNGNVGGTKFAYFFNCQIGCLNTTTSGNGYPLWNCYAVWHWNCYFTASNATGSDGITFFGQSSGGPNQFPGGRGFNPTFGNVAKPNTYWLTPVTNTQIHSGAVNLANPPTAQNILDSMNSFPATNARGFLGIVQGNGTTGELLVWSDGTDYFYIKGTNATTGAGGSGGSGTVTNVATGTGLTGGPITTTGTISMANTAVTPGSYTNANITVDAQGRLTAASNGSAGGGTYDATKITAWSTSGTVTQYTVSAANLRSAITALTAGGVIEIPPCSLSMGSTTISVPAYTHIRGLSNSQVDGNVTINGNWTLNGPTTFENLNLGYGAAAAAGTRYLINCTTADPVNLINCYATCNNNISGGYAVVIYGTMKSSSINSFLTIIDTTTGGVEVPYAVTAYPSSSIHPLVGNHPNVSIIPASNPPTLSELNAEFGLASNYPDAGSVLYEVLIDSNNAHTNYYKARTDGNKWVTTTLTVAT